MKWGSWSGYSVAGNKTWWEIGPGSGCFLWWASKNRTNEGSSGNMGEFSDKGLSVFLLDSLRRIRVALTLSLNIKGENECTRVSSLKWLDHADINFF